MPRSSWRFRSRSTGVPVKITSISNPSPVIPNHAAPSALKAPPIASCSRAARCGCVSGTGGGFLARSSVSASTAFVRSSISACSMSVPVIRFSDRSRASFAAITSASEPLARASSTREVA